MKKIILFLLFAACNFSVAMAQSAKFGIVAGYNLCSPSDFETQSGFHAGVKGEIPFKNANGLYMNVAFLFNNYNLKSEGYYYANSGNFGATSSWWKYELYYLNIPVHVGYKFKVADNVRVFANVGPYMNMGLCGKVKDIDVQDGVKKTTTSSDNPFVDDEANRFEWGVGFRIGAELCKRFQLSVGYDWGLSDVLKNNIDSKNRTFTASCAYIF